MVDFNKADLVTNGDTVYKVLTVHRNGTYTVRADLALDKNGKHLCVLDYTYRNCFLGDDFYLYSATSN